MKNNIVYIKSVFLIALLAFLYGFGSYKNKARSVKNVEIEFINGDNLFMTHQMVNKLLIQSFGDVKNQAKSLINLHDFENVVSENSLVEHAKVFMTIGGSVKTIITQRTPVARVNTGLEVYYIDKQGLKMPLSSNYSARVILVSGKIVTPDLPSVFQLVNKIRGNEFLNNLIVGIEKSADKEYVLLTRLYNQKIQLGKISELNTKFKKLEAFYNKAIADKEVKNYRTINLKYNNQVVCTKE
jgi:cell division protein FtsQ